MAQLVEHHLAKVRVAGSSPVFRSISLVAGSRGGNSPLFHPMGGSDPLPGLVLLAVSLVLAVAGFYWIYRITKDIEDN